MVPIADAAVAEDASGEPDDPGPDFPSLPPLTPEVMYSVALLPEFHITIPPDSWADLNEEPKEYVPATFRYGDEVFGYVALRLKGSATLTTLAEKPSFRIKFDKWHKDRKFAGREGLMLHNGHYDASMLREYLTQALFRAAGVPASRVGFASVYVNGVPYGVYINVEPYDSDSLAHRFADASGSLYEGDSGDDVDHSIWKYDQDSGKDESRDDLQAFADASTAGGDGIFFDPDTVLNTDEWMRYIAVEGLVGQYEGYQAPHNYYVYHEPTEDKWYFLPWNTDQTFRRKTSAFEGQGYLTRKCIDDHELCRLQYISVAQAVGDALAEFDPTAALDAAVALIDDAAHLDIRKRHSNDQMESDQNTLYSRAASWLSSFRNEVDCLEGGLDPDGDGDGYGSCYHDCDDADPDVHPGVDEPCDDIDNDCSGFADDVPACPCPSETVEGRTFYFCTHIRSWNQGRDFCEDQGHSLAKLDNETQNQTVWDIAADTGGGAWAIGLNDKGQEDTYLWPDGSAPTFWAWKDGEPAHTLPWFDCGYYVSGSGTALWRERNCSQKGRFICSGPAGGD